MLLIMTRPYRRRKFGVFFNPESSLVSAKMLTAAENLGFFSRFGTINTTPSSTIPGKISLTPYLGWFSHPNPHLSVGENPIPKSTKFDPAEQ